jgi:hypothetical protein
MAPPACIRLVPPPRSGGGAKLDPVSRRGSQQPRTTRRSVSGQTEEPTVLRMVLTWPPRKISATIATIALFAMISDF